MKTFISIAMSITFLVLSQFALAQVKGNKQITTERFPIDQVESIVVGFYADVQIDCQADHYLEITADANLLDLISKSVEEGKLELDQKEWIQPSQQIKVRIGAPQLERIEQSTHETTYVRGIDRVSFRAMALVGKIVLQGRVNELRASGEVGEVDARQLEANTANVNLWGWGTIALGSPNEITGIAKESGTVTYEGSPKISVRTSKEGRIRNRNEGAADSKFDTRFIELRIKNNSGNRINAYVKGPKPDGKYFSYGFPLNPGQVRKKNWTIGSKVYRVSSLGTRKLLIEIKEGDEGQIVKLYN